jgi:nitrous oxidase accessory protein
VDLLLTLALAIALAIPPLLLAGALQSEDEPAAPGRLEGRPSPDRESPLQARVDAALPGSTLEVEAGTYEGDLLIDRPLRLVGRGRPLLVGSGEGSVVRVRAPDVTLEGFDIDGRGGGDLGRDSSGIHVAAARVTVRDCRIREALFGVYLREAPGAVVENCFIRGIPGRAPGEKGSGIHVWSTEGFRFTGNEVVDARDGFYLQSANQGTITGNVARDLRYGLHYMYSDDNVFEDNLFENNAAGAAVMYSSRITFRRNRFLRNRGFASVGLLLQSCDDVVAEDNLIADNARGIFLEGSNRNLFRRNVVAQSDTAIVLYASSSGIRFEGNSFVGNLTPLLLVGKRPDASFAGNYWSEHGVPDLDGDGFSDRPYRLTSVFDHFRSNLTAADLFSQAFAAEAIGVAERAFPVLQPVAVVDEAPLARPPSLPDVPLARPGESGLNAAGVAGSALLLALGALSFRRTRRPPREGP